MARTVPAAYNPPDPDRSFVVGSEDIIDGSGAGDPHGGGDIASAVRYLYAHGLAAHMIQQVWPEDLWFGEIPATFGAFSDRQWHMKADGAFTEYVIDIYYEANAANTKGFRVKCQTNGMSVDLPSVDAGGADRRARATWVGSNIHLLSGDSAVPILLYTAGDGVSANKVKGFYFRRVPVADPIAAGKYYSGAFIPPDSTQWRADRPLTSDKLADLRSCLGTLYSARRRPYLCFAAHGTSTKAYVAALMAIPGSDFGRVHNYLGLSAAAQTVTVESHPRGMDGLFATDIAHGIATLAKAAVRLCASGKVLAQGNGFNRAFGQYVVKFSDPANAICCTIEGP